MTIEIGLNFKTKPSKKHDTFEGWKAKHRHVAKGSKAKFFIGGKAYFHKRQTDLIVNLPTINSRVADDWSRQESFQECWGDDDHFMGGLDHTDFF